MAQRARGGMMDLNDELLAHAARFLPAKCTALAAMTCRKGREVFGSDAVWMRLCENLGYAQKSATTRGKKPWREVYKANLCVECFGAGKIVLNLDGSNGYSTTRLVSLCGKCFDKILKVPGLSQRKPAQLLPRMARRSGNDHDAKTILYMIPVPGRKKKRPRAVGGNG
eukprot:CAMPEP_0206269682 /NCGR_PEP_ID=MMETSP0047_2-20121206/32439_1 /ASSEMBLY_ACC=CAM_ASM_000192 /TAXON_ID=195065 /ORGANISM="Chroomonas mesostigmatica_cf, Strain CCMP1168" /LENGTH=167 /DNA_ID=CAMNT_0053698221 /DNA_START=22 /DNA_END=521 /DNA_ORIENTATION=+